MRAEIEARLRPVEEVVARLDGIPGVGPTATQALLAEVGLDPDRFPTAEQVAAWASRCPGNQDSAVRHGSGKTRKGNKWLRALLVEAAQAASPKKGSYLAAQ